jgi:hypothetical protein
MAAIGWVGYRGLAEDPRTFEEAMWRRQIGLPWGGIGWPRKHYHGTLLFATPVNTSGNGALDSLGGRLADLVAEANRRRTPDSLVPREQVVRAEASLRAASGGIGMNNVSLAKWLKPGLLVTSSYSLAGDTLVVTANALYERPEPNGPLVRALGHRFRRGWLGAVVAHLDRPTLMWRGLGGLMMGFGYAGWTGSPHDVQAVADSITVRLQTEMVMMSTCDPVAHERRSILSPVCWRKPNVVGEVSTRFGEAPVNDAALRAIMARRLRVFARADSLRRAREGTAARRAGTVMGATEVR